MMVPRTRLLFWFGVIVLPFAFLAAVVPASAGLALGFIGALALLVLGDAVGGRRTLAGISVELTPVVRLSKDRAGSISVRIRNPGQRARRLRLALELPPEIHSPEAEMRVRLAGGTEWSRLAWACRANRRGRFPVQTCHLEGESPLGFWGIRAETPAAAEIRVYPNLWQERRQLAALFLNRGLAGMHVQRQVGQGRDFEKLREYIAGDGYDEIHWKATAKRGRPVTKVFQIERTQEVYVIIDASRLSARLQTNPATAGDVAASAAPPEEPATLLERYVTAALVLGLAAEQQGDLFGLVTFSDQVGKFVRAGTGTAHYHTCRDALYTLQPRAVTPDFDELCACLRLRLRRRALLIFLTSLDDPTLAAGFVRNMELLGRQHLLFVNMIQPPGVRPLFQAPDVATVDDIYERLGGHLRWQSLRELEKVLRRWGAHFGLLANEQLSAQLVTQYLKVKRRQML